MRTLRFTAELSYDNDSFHDDDAETKAWFYSIIHETELILHSNEIGDEIGTLKIIGPIVIIGDESDLAKRGGEDERR